MKPLNKVKIKWSSAFAYAIGLIATDGCLYNDGRHIDFTSKDIDLVEIFKKCFCLDNKIGRKTRGKENKKKYFHVQFGDKLFYNYLLSIGPMPAKSKTLGTIKIPDEYFIHFLRGCIDGDGNINVFKHPESNHLQLKVRLCSASKNFLIWIKGKTDELINLKGGWIGKVGGIYELSYGKNDSIHLLKSLYLDADNFLKRKYLIAQKFI